MHPVGFEPATPAGVRRQTYALGRGYSGTRTDTTEQTNTCGYMSVQTYSYCSYAITEPVGLFARSFRNICYV